MIITLPELIEIAIISACALVMLKLSSLAFKFLRTRIGKPTFWDHLKVEIVKRIIQFIIVAAVFYHVIAMKQHEVVTKVLEVTLIFVGAYISSRGVTLMLDLLQETVARESKAKHENLVFPMLGKLVTISIFVVALLISLHYLGYNITALLAGMGVMGLILSLAAKDSVSNVISGILLVLDKPFVPGDRIEIWNPPPNQGTWGDVISVGLRSTKIRTTDNITIIVPNSQLMNRDVINYTKGSPTIRLRIPVGVSYRSNLETVEKVLLQTVQGIEGVLENPQPRVVVSQFGDSSIQVELRVWIDHAKKRRQIQDIINRRIKLEFEKSSIEIPYPKRDVYIKEDVQSRRPRNESE